MKFILRQVVSSLFIALIYSGVVLGETIDPLSVSIPESSKGPDIPTEKGYWVDEINDGIYWVTNGAYQSMFMTTGSGIIVVDAPPSIGPNILRAIKSVSQEPITHMVYSHSHKDHIGAAATLPGIHTIIAQESVKQILLTANDSDRPIPTVTFKEEYTLTVGNKILQLSYPGEGHSSGNIFIYAKKKY